MSENRRNFSNEAVEKIIGNITAERQNGDGQYVPLGFTPPPPESTAWNPHYLNSYHGNSDNRYLPPLNQFNQPFSYIPQQQHFDVNDYNKTPFNHITLINSIFEPNSPPEDGIFGSDMPLLSPNLQHPECSVDPVQQPNHLFEQLAGNWVPTTSGTYSPFGNVDPFKSNVGAFDMSPERHIPIQTLNEDPHPILDLPLEDKQFNFNRTNRKPRMVAEVKPMRPSYSDVLTKPVPVTTKATKPDSKEPKQKKENKKLLKGEKAPKTTPLNRTNINAENKEPTVGKTQFIKVNNEKVKQTSSQLNRKWASLDNVNEPLLVSKEDVKKKKNEEVSQNGKQPGQKISAKKVAKSDVVDTDLGTSRNETVYMKNGLKKVNKANSTRQKMTESFGGVDRPPGKKNLRTRKRENNPMLGVIGLKLQQYLKNWWKIITVFLFWLIHLISDICSLSAHISRHIASNLWLWSWTHWSYFLDTTATITKRIRILSWIWEKFKKPETAPKDNNRSFIHSGLQNNINMPTTGDEAMKRLLACKGKDPYSILGVMPTCTDDEIKRYYKRQAFLVHPDKNLQPGAEEAFKILVHAFDMIGEPEKRGAYDKGVVESVQVEQAWSELTELLAQLQQKVEAAANTIRCSACKLRHKRVKVERPCYAARNCGSCKIHHSAREGDIWAEARCFGFLWHYYACMEGGVYDITEWAGCQKDSLKHLKPDSHQVQYRIALGKQNNQPRRHSGSLRNEKPPDLENLLNTLYGQSESTQQQGTKRRSKKAK